LQAQPDIKPEWDFQRDPKTHAWTHVLVKATGSVAFSGSANLKFGASLSGSASCGVETARVTLPVSGLAAAVVAFQIPLGTKAVLNASVASNAFTMGLEMKFKQSVMLGFEYTPVPGFHELSNVDGTASAKPTLQAIPDGIGRLSADAGIYGYAGLDLGFPAAQALDLVEPLGLAEATLGVRQEALFASANTQAQDAGYRSKYDLGLHGELGPGAAVKEALKKAMGEDAQNFTLKQSITFDHPLVTSPEGGLSASNPAPAIGDAVDFTVSLTPDTLPYLADPYNVKEVDIYRAGPNSTDAVKVASLPASSGQSSFRWTWTPQAADEGTDTFWAFVITNHSDVPLELRNDSSVPVKVGPAACLAGSAGRFLPLALCQGGGTSTTRHHEVRQYSTADWTVTTELTNIVFQADGGTDPAYFVPVSATLNLNYTFSASNDTPDSCSESGQVTNLTITNPGLHRGGQDPGQEMAGTVTYTPSGNGIQDGKPGEYEIQIQLYDGIPLPHNGNCTTLAGFSLSQLRAVFTDFIFAPGYPGFYLAPGGVMQGSYNSHFQTAGSGYPQVTEDSDYSWNLTFPGLEPPAAP
ncbi:MAG TPA: hypothetical protein VHN99_00520, partial [Deinococcales bacterium]|nr:hypothetical protein [Deinococcales bacterium]